MRPRRRPAAPRSLAGTPARKDDRPREAEAPCASPGCASRSAELRRSVGELSARLEAQNDVLERQAQVIDACPNLIVVKDWHGRFTLANRDVAEAYGTTVEEMVGRCDADFSPDARQVEKYLLSDREVMTTGRSVFIPEESITNAGGETIWLQTRKVPLAARDGRPRQVLVVCTDITARKHVELELIRAKEDAEVASHAKSAFLSSMSHELRTPLNSVIGFANVLRKNREGRLTAQEITYLERILTNGKHLLGLINDVLDLSKVEAGKAEVEIRPVALDRLVVDTLAALNGAERFPGVRVIASVPEGMAPVAADEGKLKQVIINLVGNAIRFTEHGSVTVSVVVAEGTRVPVRIDVADTGPGIPADRLLAIFEAFEQADSGTARTHGGTGLGLTISRSLCDLLGYRLEVASEVGAGSTFSIVLAPAALASSGGPELVPFAVPRPEEPADPATVAGKLVLVIDGDADARSLLAGLVREAGCRTVAASTGEEALDLAREIRPDLITLDLLLPGMSGPRVLRALKADPETRSIPVVVVSVDSRASRGSVLGAVDMVSKPVDRSELRAALRRNLAPHRRRVLVVDDEADAREILSHYLCEEGMEVRTAACGADALRELDRWPPDVIVMDLLMPGLSGPGLVEQMRLRGCEKVPVLVVTAADLGTRQLDVLRTQVQAVIRKGAELESELVSILRAVLERGGGPALVPAAPAPLTAAAAPPGP